MEPEVLHRSDASQNDHKSKGYLPVKSDKNDLKRLGYPTFIRLFKIRLNNPNTHPLFENTPVLDNNLNINAMMTLVTMITIETEITKTKSAA